MLQPRIIGQTFAWTIGIALLGTLILTLFFNWSTSVRTMFGGAFVFFLPGYFWSYVFWTSTRLSLLERTFIGILLSFLFMPLGVYLIGRSGVPVQLWSTLALGATLIITAILAVRHRYGQPSTTAS